MTVALFVDANQYLKLYGIVGGRKLLESLHLWKEHIFISAQVVDEVNRRKLSCAATFFADKLKEVAILEAPVPDLLLSLDATKRRELKGAFEAAQKARKELIELAGDALSRISRSEDDTSQGLKTLFERAVSPQDAEMERAKIRKERGNPPGKPEDPLGDQITWEQLLVYCRDKQIKRLWVISEDWDYVTQYQGRALLNAFLYTELMATGVSEVRCFTKIATGIEDFGANAGVSREKLPSEEEAKQIRREEDTLPPVGWMATSTSTLADAVRRRGRWDHAREPWYDTMIIGTLQALAQQAPASAAKPNETIEPPESPSSDR